ncbi:Flp pilus assembly protein TadG [Methylobacterium gossipiicola]|uniref:Flp pilus assembly protein TadG n=2 Tax=Methylobacterium gossipiicola TaxID=582675 RepID=A0A1I2UG49_9HYPH|nr:Flp pilus assembly protein TadG [Methylobacterium gossipiicola]
MKMLRRFRDDRRGNIAILFALVLMPLIFLLGATVDYGRASTLRAQLQNSVDGIALSLCQMSPQTSNADLEAQAAKLLTSYMPEGATLERPLNIGTDPRTITVKGSAVYQTAFVSIMRINTVEVGASSQCATPMAQTFEIALALDTTGSMKNAGGSGTKMAAAQDAAKKFIDYVASKPIFSPQTRISVVPFASGVAVDPKAYGPSTSWIDGSARSAYHWNNVDFSAASELVKKTIKSRFDIFDQLKWLDPAWSWAGCLETLPYPLNVQDAAPTQENPNSYFVPMFAPDEPGIARRSGGYIYESRPNDVQTGDAYKNLSPSRQAYYNSYLTDHTPLPDCGTKYMTAPEAETRACKYFKPVEYQSSMDLGVPNGPNFGCTSKPLQTLTKDTARLKSLIDSLSPSGSTNIFDGFMWAWRTISPLSVFAQGVPYRDTSVRKVIVLMTDGFNSWNTNAGMNINDSLFGAMGYLTNGDGTKVAGTPALAGRLVSGTAQPTSDAKARAALDALTREACINAKARNITVFTIGFNVPNDPIDQDGIALLRDCASTPSQAYVANSSTALIAAFDDIAQSIGKLRIIH